MHAFSLYMYRTYQIFDRSLVITLYCFRDYCNQLEQYQSQCEKMITEVTSALDALSDMKQKHQFVSQKTQTLHDACEQLVLEEVRRK